MFKYLIIGCGGREHAICKALSKTVSKENLYYYGPYKNPGMFEIANLINIGKLDNHQQILYWIKYHHINIAIVGPELPLQNGLVDLLIDNDVKCIGPTKDLSKLETSKGFSRNLMNSNPNLKQYNPEYRIFHNTDKSYIDYINQKQKDFVIKADGLHGGKGVKVWGDHLNTIEDSLNYCRQIHNKHESFVIEEKLVGDEFSLMSFVNGNTLKHMPPIRDFKRLYDNDKGPNTGSMGSINYIDYLTREDIIICQNINQEIIETLHQYQNNTNTHKYCGILYGSFMKTKTGKIKVIEFNCRFGDPECINVLYMLETPLQEIFDSMLNNTLSEMDIKFNKEMVTICKYLVPNGYPNNPIKNHEFYINNYEEIKEYLIFASSILETFDQQQYFKQLGSRTLAVICHDNDITKCYNKIENIINQINGPLFYRKDIGLLSKSSKTQLTYKDSGVNINEADKVIKGIKEYVEKTFTNSINKNDDINNFGDFGGCMDLSIIFNYKKPILVSSIDGVGTKSSFVLKYKSRNLAYEGFGHDIVNHCINDILVKGARPLFFLDYYGTSNLKAEDVVSFVKGLSEALQKHKCVLLGGETAEMPSYYYPNKSDLVGCITGVVEKDKIIDGKKNIQPNDHVLGLRSSGPHTNGYSLIRKICQDLKTMPENVLASLCAPHKSYLYEINELETCDIKINGLVHITGGGWDDNIKRVLPDNLKIGGLDSYQFTEPFDWLMKTGNISRKEMMKTFNCGIGMLIFVNKKDYNRIVSEELLDDYVDIGVVYKK